MNLDYYPPTYNPSKDTYKAIFGQKNNLVKVRLLGCFYGAHYEYD